MSTGVDAPRFCPPGRLRARSYRDRDQARQPDQIISRRAEGEQPSDQGGAPVIC